MEPKTWKTIVKAYAALAAILALIAAYYFLDSASHGVAIGIIILMAIPIILWGVLAYGLWMTKVWARMLAIVAFALSAIVALLLIIPFLFGSLFNGSVAFLASIAIHPWVLPLIQDCYASSGPLVAHMSGSMLSGSGAPAQSGLAQLYACTYHVWPAIALLLIAILLLFFLFNKNIKAVFSAQASAQPIGPIAQNPQSKA